MRARGLGRALASSFRGKEPLYWTEHSERNVLTSLAAAMGFPKAERDFLGRWLPGQSDDCIRTARSVVHKVQKAVAERLRLMPDEVQEADELDRFIEYAANTEDDVRLVDLRVLLDYSAARGDTDGVATRATAYETEPLPIQPRMEDEGAGLDMGDCGKYYLSYTAKKNVCTLHITGGCWRRPGRDIKIYTYHQDIDGLSYARACKDCWGAAGPRETGPEAACRSPAGGGGPEARSDPKGECEGAQGDSSQEGSSSSSTSE